MTNAAPVLTTAIEVDDALLEHIPLAVAGVCNGRLTLESGVAVPATDQTAKTVIYFTPYQGAVTGLYDGTSKWVWAAFSEKSIKLTDTQTGSTTNGSASVTGLTDTSQFIVGMEVTGTGIAGGTTIATIAGPTSITLSANATATGSASLTFKVAADTNIDIFGYASSGALKLEMVKWTNATTRATSITLQDGVYVKGGATTKRYLGTVRTTGTAGQTEDSLAKRFVWNAQNRRLRAMAVYEATDSWNYTTNTWRQLNNNTANQLAFVRGLDEDGVTADASVYFSNSSTTGTAAGLGIALDGAAGGPFVGIPGRDTCAIANTIQQMRASYRGTPTVGYHFLAVIEIAAASGTNTFYGDAGLAAQLQSGIIGEVLA